MRGRSVSDERSWDSRPPASREPSAFATSHASVPAVCFGGITLVTMLAPQPVLVGLSLAGALLFSLLVRGVRATLAGLRWQLPLLALVTLANPLFSASGSTLLWQVGPVSVFLESLAFGGCMGALMVASVLWLEDAAAVLVQDRLLSLAGRRARSLPLVTSMAAQLVPRLVRRGTLVRAQEAACTAAGRAEGGRARGLVRASGVLLAWALEDSLVQADVLRARGWESGCRRTSFRPDALSAGDVWALTGLILLLGICGLLAWVACAQWRFYPVMPRLVAWWGYVPCALLMLVPSAAELLGRLREANSLRAGVARQVDARSVGVLSACTAAWRTRGDGLHG